MTLTTVPPEIQRDRYGRPMVTPPGGGKPVAYSRCTSYVSVLEDTFQLSRWSQRMVATGLADRPDLLLSIAAHHDDKAHLNGVCEQAIEAAKAHAAATVGTALHALAEQADLGRTLGVIPDAYRADIDAYTAATAGFDWQHIETFTVHDGLRIGGTPDRIGRTGDGRLIIGDIKTGSIEWGIGKIAMQLAVYAHSQLYDHTTGTRTDLDGIDLERALIIHLPAGTGRCDLVEVDIAAGWEAVALATQVRDWRKRKNLSRPYQASAVDTPPPVATALGELAQAIGDAQSVGVLTALWQANQRHWTDSHTQLAKARRALLEAGI